MAEKANSDLETPEEKSTSTRIQCDDAQPLGTNTESDEEGDEVEKICQSIPVEHLKQTTQVSGTNETCEKRMLSPSPTTDFAQLYPCKSAKVYHGELPNSEGKQSRRKTAVASSHLNECAVFHQVLKEINLEGSSSRRDTEKFVPISVPSISQDIRNHSDNTRTDKTCSNVCGTKNSAVTCTQRDTKLEPGILHATASSRTNVAIHTGGDSPSDDNERCAHPPHINDLPMLLMSQIFSYLTMKELLCTASLVCKAWYQAAREPGLWKRVQLDRPNIVDEDMWNVVSINPNMSLLHITDCRQLTGKGVAKALAVCSALKELVIMRCNQLKGDAFLDIGLHCPLLTKINFSNSNGVPDEALEKIAANCPNLTELRLNRCSLISDSSIQEVARCCPKLQVLTFQENQRVTDVSLSAVCSYSHNMEVLSLHKCAISNHGIVDVRKLTRLRNLDLSNLAGLTSDSVGEVVSHLPQLRTLNLCLTKNINDSCLYALAASCKKLKYLFLVSCSITDEGLISIGRYSRSIEHLDVGWCQDITDHGATALSQMCSQLKYLGLVRCDQITEACVGRLVKEFPHIHYSTFLLDSQRLLEKAKQQGYQVLSV